MLKLKFKTIRRVSTVVSLLAAVGWVDFITGWEINFFFFYFLPIGMAAWWFGRSSSVATAILSSVIFYAVDILSGHVYSTVWIGVWNAGLRLATFLLFGLFLWRIQADQRRLRKLNEQVNRAVAELRNTTTETVRLRAQLAKASVTTKRDESRAEWFSESDEEPLALSR